MHPSKIQQSTTKEPDSGLRLGFADIGASKNQQTPSKPMADSSFEFRFARPGPQLSAEAQHMMDGLREEALRVKARLIAEREEAAKNAGEVATNGIAGRKIAQAKGKAGRFSDVHMAEFKKMDSIADHPSSFRAQPGRLAPAKPALKRSQSQAKLDEREEIKEQPSRIAPVKPALKRSRSQAKLQEREDIKEQAKNTRILQSERLENDAPPKRARKGLGEDTSSARPVSRDNKPSTPQKQANTLAFITTPTHSSLARAASIKKPTTHIPTLSRSPSKPNLNAAPTMYAVPTGLPKSTTTSSLSSIPKSEPKSFLRSPGKVERLKSMLRYPSMSAKKPAAPSALPVFALSPTKPDFNKALPSLPTTPGGYQQSKSIKHVSFTPEAVDKNADSIRNSPSPVKSGIPRSISRLNLQAKNLSSQPSVNSFKPLEVSYPSIADHPSVKEQSKTAELSTLTGMRPLPMPPRPVTTERLTSLSGPGTFTFRSDHTINFAKSPTGFGSSPGQASVRQVRSSIFGGMPGSFPVSNKENTPIHSAAHGFSNKKRHRAESEEDNEEEVERSPKKLKTGATPGPSLMTQKLEAAKTNSSSRTPSPKKKGLSLSRLNMLSRPKMRK